ncbi:endoplasmic reticulum-Golgi intermediate compartment protein 1-like [Bolinopsis microptera]|uniref:endoplasmic reticulum-Golgi intermediate compartment protein 1-like n=1 Tax=Bolinopsis microptera TaxID=2820187 RepID=UPI00307A250E
MRRVPRTLSQSSSSGGVLSVLTCIVIVMIFYSQFSMWMSPVYKRRTIVHRDSEDDHVPVSMNITFLKAHCDDIAFKIHDQFSKITNDITNHVMRKSTGSGCRMYVAYELKRISGEFVFTSKDNKTDMSHYIEGAVFGDTHRYAYTKAFHALKGVRLRDIGSSTHDYIVKLLETTFIDLSLGEVASPYQYTFSYRSHLVHNKKDGTPPSIAQHYIRFKYAWSPLLVEYIAEYNTLYDVITNSIAYCGGLLTTVEVLHRAFIGGSAFIKENMYKKL